MATGLVSRALVWHHRQAECFARGDRLGHTAYFKYGSYEFSSARDWHEALELLEIDPHPRCFFAQSRGPQVAFFDAEVYTPDETQAGDVFAKLRRIIQRFTEFVDDAVCDSRHACENHAYFSCGSRDTGKLYDPETHRGGFKHSYHVIIRCTHHHYASIDDLYRVMHTFLDHIENRVMAPYAFINDQFLIDRAVYTKHRAFRMVGSAKDPGGVPLQAMRGLSPHDDDDLMHNHAYIPPGTVPMVVPGDMLPERARLARRVAADAARVVPVAQETITANLQRILMSLGRRDLVAGRERVTALGDTAAVINAVFQPVARGSPAFDHWRAYQNWFSACRLLCCFHPDLDAAQELWCGWAAQFGKDDDPMVQWNKMRAWAKAPELSINGFIEKHAQYLPMIEINIAMQAYGDVPCLCDPDASHPSTLWAARVDNRYLPAIILHCVICRAKRFFGYIGEDSYVFDSRYMADCAELMDVMRRAIETPIPRQRPNATLLDRWISQADLPRRTIVLAGQMGTGKTHAMRVIEHAPKGVRILMLSMRVLLARSLYHRYRPFLPDLALYCEKKGNLSEYNQLVIQLDSLKRLVHQSRVRPYDIVIMDEPSSLFAHLTSTTIDKHRIPTAGILTWLIEKARVLVVADADIGEREFAALKALRHDTHFHTFRNVASPLRRVHRHVRNHRTWLGRMTEKINAGKNIYIVSNARDKLVGAMRTIARETGISEADMLMYTRDTDQETKSQVGDCNAVWPRYRVVGFTTVISAGIDFSVPHFHCGFVYGTNVSACPREVHQQAGRVRHLIDGELFVCIPCPKEGVDDNLTMFKDIATAKSTIENLYNRWDQQLEPFFARTTFDDRGRMELPDDTLTMILLYNLVELKHARYDFFRQYCIITTIHGDITDTSADEDNPLEFTREYVDEIELDVHDSQCSQLANAVRPSNIDDAIEANQRGEATEYTPHQFLNDFWCCMFRVREITDPVLFGVVTEPGFIERLHTFLILTSPHGISYSGDFVMQLARGKQLATENQLDNVFAKLHLSEKHPVTDNMIALRAKFVKQLLDALEIPHAGIEPRAITLNACKQRVLGFFAVNCETLQQLGLKHDFRNPPPRLRLTTWCNQVLDWVNYRIFTELRFHWLSRIRIDQMLCAASRVVDDPSHIEWLQRLGRHSKPWFQEGPVGYDTIDPSEVDLAQHRERRRASVLRTRLRRSASSSFEETD